MKVSLFHHAHSIAAIQAGLSLDVIAAIMDFDFKKTVRVLVYGYSCAILKFSCSASNKREQLPIF